MKKFSAVMAMMFLMFLLVSVAYADMLDLSTFQAWPTGDPGVEESGGTITFTEGNTVEPYLYFYDPDFHVDSTAISITFDYTLDIGIDNEDYLVVTLDYTDYGFLEGDYNSSTTASLILSGSATVDLTSYVNSTIDLAFGFEANDWGTDSVGSFSNIQINYSTSSTPEPTTIVLLGLGLLGMAGVGRKMS